MEMPDSFENDFVLNKTFYTLSSVWVLYILFFIQPLLSWQILTFSTSSSRFLVMRHETRWIVFVYYLKKIRKISKWKWASKIYHYLFICFPTFQFKPRNLPLVLHVILLLCNNIAFLAFTNKKLIACSDKGILDHACSKVLAGGQGVICESSQRMLCLKLLWNITRKEERFALFKARENHLCA